MRNFGLSDTDFQILNDVLIQPLKGLSARVYLFGSRVGESYHQYADVDLLYEFKDPPSNEIKQKISEIKEAIENSNLTVKVDLVNLEDLANSYRENVLSERVEL